MNEKGEVYERKLMHDLGSQKNEKAGAFSFTGKKEKGYSKESSAIFS